MKHMKALAALVMAAALALILVACGGSAGSEGSGTGTSPSDTSGEATGQAPSVAYFPERFDSKRSDGSTSSESFSVSSDGRQLSDSFELTSSESAYRADWVASDWDEYGHTLKAVQTEDSGDGKPITIDEETVSVDLDPDGVLLSHTFGRHR